jgi:hypothetical protein
MRFLKSTRKRFFNEITPLSLAKAREGFSKYDYFGNGKPKAGIQAHVHLSTTGIDNQSDRPFDQVCRLISVTASGIESRYRDRFALASPDIEVSTRLNRDRLPLGVAVRHHLDLAKRYGFVDAGTVDTNAMLAVFSDANRSHAGSDSHDTIALEYFLCGIIKMFRENAKVGHHED